MRFMYACDPDPSQYVTIWGPMHRYNYFLWLSDGSRKTGPDANIMEKSFMYSILGRDASEEVETCVKRSRKITRWKLLVQFYYIAKPGILLIKVSLASSFYNAMILHILSAAKGALDAEVFSELAQILKGAEAESATVPRMIQELGHVLRESPEKDKFLNMTIESSAVRVVHQLRLLCHQLSQRMVQEGRLPSPELLFFLTYEEIGVLLQTRSPELVLKAQRRQKIHAEADKCLYASIFVGMPKPIERTKIHVEGDFEIKGSPMSQGTVEGRVRVAHTFDDAHLIQKGEILVTTATDTGWTPYFPLLAGVVTELGGPLSH
ncbi:hypothetical protein MTO96_050785, partial [Rhipicephalus appendiculatus]